MKNIRYGTIINMVLLMFSVIGFVIWEIYMKKRDELKYLKMLLKRVHSSLKAYDKKGEQEKLHEFRVEVKKIKAFLILADSAAPKSRLLKKFKPIDRIFRRAGKIRSASINMKINSSVIPIKQRQQQLSIADQKFRRNRRHDMEKIKHAGKQLEGSIKSINNIHISLFYEKHLQQISGFLKQGDFSGSLHECRKQLKILLYNYRLVGPLLVIKLNERYLDQLQQAIGDWHDTVEAASGTATGLNGRQKQSMAVVSDLATDFYARATIVNDIPILQID
ncbi:CHAD domain-containing protein [Mucilaginibacter sp.]